MSCLLSATEPAPPALRRGVGRAPLPPSLSGSSRPSSTLSSSRSRSFATAGCGGAGAMRQLCRRGRVLGIAVAIAHGVFSGSLNILLKFLISRYQFSFLTLVQCLTSSTAALSLELLRRLGFIAVPPFGLNLARSFAGVAVLSTLQSSLTLWSLRGLSLPMYVVFKRCLPLVTMLIGVLVLKNGAPSPGVLAAVLITTCGAALAGELDPRGPPTHAAPPASDLRDHSVQSPHFQMGRLRQGALNAVAPLADGTPETQPSLPLRSGLLL